MAEPGSSFVPLIEVVRGEVVESIHFGAVVVADADGRTRSAVGAADVTTYLRSATKPFQLLPLVERGAAEALGLAVKVSDGDAAGRARGPATAEALRQLGVLSDADLDRFGPLARPEIRNVAGRHVGHVRPAFRLGT